jgi:membrane protease YdiL (CAAX protease family)
MAAARRFEDRVPAPKRAKAARGYGVTSYFDRTLWPLQSLYFLLPLLVFYELGTVLYAPAGDERLPAIYAERLVGQAFEWLGVTGYYLPGLIVVVVLLAIHFSRGDPWKPEGKLYAGMAVESVLWAIPLFLLGTLLAGTPTAAVTVPAAVDAGGAGVSVGVPNLSWSTGVVLSIGAGIYEELLFRLMAIALLDLLFHDVLALPKSVSGWLAILVSALLFAWYHFGEANPFGWARFTFYLLAGLYFGVIYVTRGFGIVAATHAIYDLLAIATHLR